MIVPEITLFNSLRTKLGEQDAQTVVEGIKQTVREEFENKKEIIATKAGIMRLENKLNDQLKWIMATVIAMGGLIVALIKLL